MAVAGAVVGANTEVARFTAPPVSADAGEVGIAGAVAGARVRACFLHAVAAAPAPVAYAPLHASHRDHLVRYPLATSTGTRHLHSRFGGGSSRTDSETYVSSACRQSELHPSTPGSRIQRNSGMIPCCSNMAE